MGEDQREGSPSEEGAQLPGEVPGLVEVNQMGELVGQGDPEPRVVVADLGGDRWGSGEEADEEKGDGGGKTVGEVQV